MRRAARHALMPMPLMIFHAAVSYHYVFFIFDYCIAARWLSLPLLRHVFG